MIKLKASSAVFLMFIACIHASTDEQQNAYSSGTSSGIKAKKIQIVYIKVPLSKVLQGQGQGSSNNERGVGYNDGGVRNNLNGGANNAGITGESQNYKGNFNGENYNSLRHNFGSFGDHGSNNFGKQNDISYGSMDGNYANSGFPSNGNLGVGLGLGVGGGGARPACGSAGPACGGSTGYQNDANLGMAYGAAVGNALPQSANFDDSANYGQESQSHEFNQPNQIGFNQNGKGGKYGQNDGPDGVFGQNIQFGSYGPPAPHSVQGFNGDIHRPYLGDNFEKNKKHKGNQFQQMIAAGNYKQQIPMMAQMPSFEDPLKEFMPQSFGSASFPSFGGKGFSGTSFGSFGGLSGLGGIKNKLSMLLGGKFGGLGGGGGGGGGGLLGGMGGMLGWD